MTRSFALCASAVLLAAAACGAQAADPPRPPAEGVLLLSLRTGAFVGQAALGSDPLAVTLAPDGSTAYVVDNDLGDVFAIQLPALKQLWRTHLGGRPGSALVRRESLFVSQYDTDRVAELDRSTGGIRGSTAVAHHPGALAVWHGQVVTAGGDGFGVAVADGALWTDSRLHLPAGLHPFWIQPGSPGELLVSAEGAPEDTTPGGVFAVSTATGSARRLAEPRDPDQVIPSGGDIFVAAHGDREVLVLRGAGRLHWARGAEVVALAPDPALGLLVVVTDAEE